MTNRKIKDFHKNRILYNCMTENVRNLCRIMLALNKTFPKQFYPKRIIEWLSAYKENCTETNKLDAIDAYDYKLEQWCEEYGIDTQWCTEFVKRNSPSIRSPQNILVLVNNVKLALVQTCSEFGLGDKRMQELKAALEEEQPREPEKELAKFGLEYEFGSVGEVDYRRLVPEKKQKVNYADLKRGYEGLAALKAYQDSIIGG